MEIAVWSSFTHLGCDSSEVPPATSMHGQVYQKDCNKTEPY